MNYNVQKWCKLILVALVLIALCRPAVSYAWRNTWLSRQDAPSKAAQSFAPALDWRPTHTSSGARYAGNDACAQCHTQTATQPTTPMGIALENIADSRILSTHPRLTFKSGPYTYTITREGNRSIYSVTDGRDTITTPLLYAFGQGKVGQTYVLEYEGKFYESGVSFFNEIKGLDYTLGSPRQPAKTLKEAVGRLMDAADTKECFSCHSTASVSDNKLQLDKLTPGVTCEGCHGPGANHIAAMKARRQPGAKTNTGAPSLNNTQILNPGRFDTDGQSQFCGACHRTWTHVSLMRLTGVANVRFQPYRIFGSKCYDFDDKRISCTACHNPHEELKHDAAFYDAKCLACHQADQKVKQTGAAANKFPACPVGKQNCASCHMPKYELPGSHYKFTDHRIRVTRPGEPYPN